MTLLSDRLQEILDENPDLAQRGLAVAAEVSKSVVNQWMDGKIQKMNIDAALNIEQNLGYDHIWLMTGRGAKKAPKTTNVTSIRPQLSYLDIDEMEIITCYREATEAGRKSIATTASSVTKKSRRVESVGNNQG